MIGAMFKMTAHQEIVGICDGLQIIILTTDIYVGLKRTFELMPGGKELKMSASLEVQIPTSDEVSQRISAGGES